MPHLHAVFRFKHFSVAHDRCAVKVGTDSLLLGAWTDFGAARRIMDVGSGCGVLALIAAQRNATAMIDAVEIDDAAAAQASENFAASPWPGRLRAYRMDVRKLRTEERYDLVISNPPYYEGEMVSPDDRHTVARHGGELSLVELIDAAAGLLTAAGGINLIVPVNREVDLLAAASKQDLHVRRRCEVHYVEGRAPKRLLLEFSHGPQTAVNESVTVTDAAGAYTATYRSMLADLKEFT